MDALINVPVPFRVAMPRRATPTRRVVVVETTFPAAPRGASGRFAARAVAARLAACGNVMPGVRSVYWWNGRRERAREVLISFKTTPRAAPALVAWLRREHPYEVPFVAVLPVGSVMPAYARWVHHEVGRASRTGRVRRRR